MTIRAIVNTVVFPVASVVLQFVIGFAMAVYLNRQFAGYTFLRRIIVIPWVMPLVVTGDDILAHLYHHQRLGERDPGGDGLVHSPINWLTSGDLAVLRRSSSPTYGPGSPSTPSCSSLGSKTSHPSSWRRRRSTAPTHGSVSRRVTVPSMRPVIMIVLMLGVVYTLKAFDIVWVLTQRRAGEREPADVVLGLYAGFLGVPVRYGRCGGQYPARVLAPGRRGLHLALQRRAQCRGGPDEKEAQAFGT